MQSDSRSMSAEQQADEMPMVYLSDMSNASITTFEPRYARSRSGPSSGAPATQVFDKEMLAA